MSTCLRRGAGLDELGPSAEGAVDAVPSTPTCGAAGSPVSGRGRPSGARSAPSPLAVLRVLFGAGVVGFAVVGRLGTVRGTPGVAASCIAVTTFALWMVLLGIRSIRPNPCRLLSVYWTSAVATLVVVDRSGQASVVLGFLLVPSTVFVSLFFRRRVALCQLAVAFVALWVAFATGRGVATGFLMAALAVGAMSSAPFTVLLGARASRRSGLADPETGLPNAVGLVEEFGTTAADGAVVAVVAFGGVGACRRRSATGRGRTPPPRRRGPRTGAARRALVGRIEGDEVVVVVPGRHDGPDAPAGAAAPDLGCPSWWPPTGATWSGDRAVARSPRRHRDGAGGWPHAPGAVRTRPRAWRAVPPPWGCRGWAGRATPVPSRRTISACWRTCGWRCRTAGSAWRTR